jgi:ribonuclease D
LDWVREECVELSKVRPVQNNHAPLFLNFKGAGKLDPQCLAVLEALLHYRHAIARQKDKPLFKILSNRSLLTLATQQPTTLRQLEQSGALSRKQIGMYGEAVIDAVSRARRTPRKELPEYPRMKPPALDPAIPKRIKALKIWRDKCARKLKIAPGILFNKALLTALATHYPQNMGCLRQTEGIKGWQVAAFGKEIINVLKHTP